MKKSSWLKGMLALLTVGLAVGLAACGNSSSDNTSSKGTTSNKTVTISFWHGMNGPYQTALNDIISDFNKSQSKYKVVGTAQGNYTALQQKIMAAAKSRKLPVISQTTYTTVPDYQKNSLIESLDPYMLKGSNKLSSADLKDIYPAFLDSSKYDGNYYSIPFSKSVRIMYYNQDILDKYNLSIPTTWEELEKMGATLKKDGIYAMGFDKSFDMEYEGLTRSVNNPIVAPKTLKVNANSKKSVAAASFIMNMINNGYAKTAGEDIYFTQGFIQGKAAFYAGSSAGITQMKKQAPSSLKWGTVALPSYEGKKATEVAGNDIVMFKSASEDEKKGAWAFMKYLMSDKVTAKWAMATGYLPLRKSAMKTSTYKKFLTENPTSQAANDSLPDGFQSTAFIGFSEYRTNLLNAVDSMLTKNEAPQKALDTLQTSTKKIIKDNDNK